VKGLMTQQWTVWCRDCERWDQVSGGRRSAAEEFRRMGWKRRLAGWVCGACDKKAFERGKGG